MQRTPPPTPPPSQIVEKPTSAPTIAEAITTTLLSEPGILSQTTSLPDIHAETSNITERKKRKFDEGSDCSITATLSGMFRDFAAHQDKRFNELQSTMKILTEQNEELRETVTLMSSKYDEFLARIDELESERKDDKKHIKFLETKIENMERKTRASGIEIRNVPKTTSEGQIETKDDLCDLVSNMGKAINVEINKSEIRDIYRINSKDTNKPIIAEFTSVLTKEKVITSVKNFNKTKPKGQKLNTSHLHLKQKILTPIPVFISETLTQVTQKLYYLARNYQKDHHYAFCWTSRGTVYLRKAENTPRIPIQGEVDLERLIKSE